MAKSTLLEHPDLPAIEAGLAKRIPLRKLAARYGVSMDSLHRYKHRLMRDAPELFAKAAQRDWKVSPEELEKLRLETSHGWLANIRAELGRVLHFRDVAIADDNQQAASTWTGHARKYFELIGNAAAQLSSHTVNNVTQNFNNSPDFWLFQRLILTALVDHPAAREAVLLALESIGNNSEPALITVDAVAREVAV
jgi:hypothetical protein